MKVNWMIFAPHKILIKMINIDGDNYQFVLI